MSETTPRVESGKVRSEDGWLTVVSQKSIDDTRDIDGEVLLCCPVFANFSDK